jgi:hypothetical protein
MKITKKYLQNLIKEEVSMVMELFLKKKIKIITKNGKKYVQAEIKDEKAGKTWVGEAEYIKNLNQAKEIALKRARAKMLKGETP